MIVAYQAPAPWDFLGKNTGVGCHFLSPGNLPNRGIQGIIYYLATGKILLSLGLGYSRHFLINWIIEYVVFYDWLLHFMYKFFCGHKFPVLLDIYPRSRISGSYSNFMFNFWGTAKFPSNMVVSLYIPTGNIWDFQFLNILINNYYCLTVFDYSSPSGCEVVTRCGFGLDLTDF